MAAGIITALVNFCDYLKLLGACDFQLSGFQRAMTAQQLGCPTNRSRVDNLVAHWSAFMVNATGAPILGLETPQESS